MLEITPSPAAARAAHRNSIVRWVRNSARGGLTAATAGLLTAVLSLAAMALGYRWSEREGMDQLFDVTAERLALYAAALEGELRRIENLPALLALDEDVAALWANPGPAARERAARKLSRLNVRADSQLMYVVDREGHVLAASQAELPEARLDAIARALRPQGRGFFAARSPSGGTDYYRAQAVAVGGETQGWIVVRINLAPLEATWTDLGVRSQSERVLVLDENDVVIMSSVQGWKYRTLNDVTEYWQRELRASGRYPDRPLTSLSLEALSGTADAAPLIQVKTADGAAPEQYVAQERALPPLGLRMVALSDRADVLRNARAASWAVGAMVALAGVILIYLLHRQRVLVQLFKARNELQAAREDLERQVERRTAELLGANAELETQIQQRRQSEEELIQAGKLAVLGQMSAGLAHELNQPLTALRALAGNTMRLLQAGRHDALASNLQSIGDVADRMGRITSQLKTFARRRSEAAGPICLATAIQNTRLLVEHRLAAECVSFEFDAPPDLHVLADGTRLEQVLLNLVTNALDAMAGSAERRLRVEGQVQGGRVLVRIADTGHGLDDSAYGRLFEPFFTTKPAGQGLGLGLVISSKIVREFGGVLHVRRGNPGTVCEFDLAQAEDTSHV